MSRGFNYSPPGCAPPGPPPKNSVRQMAMMSQPARAPMKMMKKTQNSYEKKRMDSSDLFDMDMGQMRQQQANDIGFQEIEKTAEYMETHYYKSTEIYNKKRLPNSSIPFWGNYLSNLISEQPKPFLTDSYVFLSGNDIPFAFALLDIAMK